MKFLKSFVLSASALVSGAIQAADTDIFEPNPHATVPAPNVMILLDNTANWSAESGGQTKKVLMHEALYKVLMSLDPDTVNIGIGVFADAGTGDRTEGSGVYSTEGAKFLSKIKLLTDANRQDFANLLYKNAADLSLGVDDDTGELVINGFLEGQEAINKANNGPLAFALNETLAYYAGTTPEATRRAPWDTSTVGADGKYISPINSTNSCGANYIIYLANGEPASGENNKAELTLKSHGASTTTVELNDDFFEASMADEYSRFLSNTDVNDDVPSEQTIVTHVIDIYDIAKNTKKFKGARALLKSMANEGKGEYYHAKDSDAVVNALDDIFDNILDKSSVFAASALPVSVNNRGTNLNQVYMGVFQPDRKRRPRWYGNLKLYKVGKDATSGSLHLEDQNNKAIRDASRGFVKSNVQSFWTHTEPSGDHFFDYAPRGTHDGNTASDNPDGEVVEKGGVAQNIRESYLKGNTRKLYTCSTCSGSLEPITATNSELSSDTLNWLYGANNAADRDGTPLTDQTALEKNNSDEGTRDVRASVHGDVIHSQPTIINYGKELADGTIVDDIVVYYGSNDGVFRAVQGGQSDTLSGHELWGFVHKSHFPDIETLRNNESGLVNIGDNRKPWFFDGDISSYFEDANKNGVIETGDKAYIYLTMRRGGNYVYGLDVSDYNNPKVLFDPISSSTAGFSEMAQSWSGVTITKIKGHTNPVMVFGAGYDASAQDAGPDSLSGSSSAGAVTKGRGIYVVDAVTGDKVVSIGPGTSSSTHVNVPGMTYDVPSKVAVLDVNGNGYADRFYVSDTGGNIWRVDTENDPAPADWTVTHFATASEDYDGDSSNDGRKLMYRVDVVSAKESDGTEYHAVLVGSGDREHPFDVSVQNYMMMFKDEYTGILSSQLSPITFSSLYNATANLIQDGSDKEAQIALLDSAKGWYIALREGEKVVSHVTSLAGVAYFNTNQPAPADPLACGTNLGIARIYQISVTNATAVRDNNAQGGITVDDRSYEVPGGGYPPPPVHIIVEIGGEFQEAVISGTEVNASPSNFNERSRNFWTKEFD